MLVYPFSQRIFLELSVQIIFRGGARKWRDEMYKLNYADLISFCYMAPFRGGDPAQLPRRLPKLVLMTATMDGNPKDMRYMIFKSVC